MSVTTAPPTAWRLPASLPEDLAAMAKNVAQFKAGTLTATQFQVFRVPQGVYEQREAGAYMLRVRFPAGVVLPHQMRRLAEVAEKYGNSVLHVTTRQDIQVHRVPLEGIHPALSALAEAGLATKGGGGNTVRNITGCPHAGVCPDELFDITPHALALTELLLADPASFQLPRKFKLAFAGCGQDCSGATINDLGFIARLRDGVEGFGVYAGGGLGASSQVARLLEEFVPADDAPLVAEAVKRVFHAHGNRKDKRQARLRFLIRQLGWDAFKTLYRRELASLRAAPAGKSPLPPATSPQWQPSTAPATAPLPAAPDFQRWLAANVKPQKQPGFFRVEIPLFLGDIAADKLRGLAAVVEAHGERAARATQRQNLGLRWVSENELAALHAELSTVGLAQSYAPLLRDLIACAGASTCKLGICLSRGLAQATADALARAPLNLEALGDLQLNISGCPNACGRHPLGHLGLYGAARRVHGRLVPHYVLQCGGRVGEGITALAVGHHVIAAAHIPALLVELLSAFEKSPHRPDFQAFLTSPAGTQLLDGLAAKYSAVPNFTEDRNFYFDWGALEPFSLAGRGPGECGAGVVDLIQVDLQSAAEALREKRYYAAAALAARALLVTRGEQPNSEARAFELFRTHFLESGLLEAHFQPLVTLGLRAASARDPVAEFTAAPEEVSRLVEAVERLFKSMDATLQFSQRRGETPSPTATPAKDILGGPAAPALAKDFRGVACPLNYVKTKIALDALKSGQVLAVLLDGNGARNVPASAAKDGHTVISIMPAGNDAQVLIRKK